MPSLPAASTRLPPDIEQGLRALLLQHLQAQGLVLAPPQLAACLDAHRADFTQWLEHCVQQGRAQSAASQPIEISLPPADAFAEATRYVPPTLDAHAPMPVIDMPQVPIPSEPMPPLSAIHTTVEPATGPSIAPAPVASDAASPATDSAATPAPVAPPAPVASPMPSPAPPLHPVRLPNATAGKPYAQVLDFSRTPQLAGWRLIALQLPADCGLQFDTATSQLQGTPLAPPGQSLEHQLQGRLARIDGGSEGEQPIRLDLLVNADPRTLWKDLEPEPGQPFAKPHQQAHVRRENGWQAVAASQRGRSHANVGSFREDHFHFTAHEGWVLLAVSDGAGSAKLSRRGSELACETAIQTLQTHLSALTVRVDAALAAGCPDLSAQVLEPLGTAAFTACKAIGDEAKKLGREEKEFSATLLLAAVRPHAQGFFVASYWIGDGALALFDPTLARLQLLGEADGGEFSGQTRFLLSPEFRPDPWAEMKKRIRCAWAPKTATLVLMSDGVSDPKFGTDNALKDPARWRHWWQQDLCAEVDLRSADETLREQLLRYLAFWSPGEHDDRTLALWQPLTEAQP